MARYIDADKTLAELDKFFDTHYKIELKPCPFCGFKPEIVELKDNIKWNYKIQCSYCGAMFYENTVHACIARWNARANNDG